MKNLRIPNLNQPYCANPLSPNQLSTCNFTIDSCHNCAKLIGTFLFTLNTTQMRKHSKHKNRVVKIDSLVKFITQFPNTSKDGVAQDAKSYRERGPVRVARAKTRRQHRALTRRKLTSENTISNSTPTT